MKHLLYSLSLLTIGLMASTTIYAKAPPHCNPLLNNQTYAKNASSNTGCVVSNDPPSECNLTGTKKHKYHGISCGPLHGHFNADKISGTIFNSKGALHEYYCNKSWKLKSAKVPMEHCPGKDKKVRHWWDKF